MRRARGRAQGRTFQIDSYFNLPEGRLKLRQSEPGGDELIFYRRPDVVNAKESDYSIVEAHSGLLTLLSDALGVKTVVRKTRSVWLWDGVRIHLDRVEGLGDFIEFEAVLSADRGGKWGRGQISSLRRAFEIPDEDLLTSSYQDMILSKEQRRP